MSQEPACALDARFGSVDRRRLEHALSAAREARVYRRIEAVLYVAEGHAISEAARPVRAPRLSMRYGGRRAASAEGTRYDLQNLREVRGLHEMVVESCCR